MGGERASTTRMRESGRICCSCKVPLESPPAKERYCERCEPRHKVYMHFMSRNGWHVSFLEADLKTTLPGNMTFQDSAKVIELALRGGAGRTLADRQAIEQGIQMGRGSVWLNLTAEQYGKLRRGKR